MKLALILIISTLVSQQATLAHNHQEMGNAIFDGHPIMSLIRSGESRFSTIFTNPNNLMREIPEDVIKELAKARNRVKKSIDSEAEKSIVKLANVRVDADNMIDAYFFTQNSTLLELINCLIGSGVDAKAFYDAVKETAKTCVNIQYEKGVAFIEEFWKKFTQWASASLLNTPVVYETCKLHQNGLFDIVGAIRKLDCMVKAQIAFNANAAGFFAYASTAVTDFLKLSQEIPRDLFTCASAATKSISDFNKETLEECKNKT